MDIEKLMEARRQRIAERVAMLVLAHGVDTARRIIIREHNRAETDNAKLACQVGLRMLAEMGNTETATA